MNIRIPTLLIICCKCLLLLSISSCVDSNKTVPKDLAVKKTFPNAINGVWVVKTYAKDLKATSSPRSSYRTLQGIPSILINAANATDSTEIGVSYSHHEGGSFILYANKDAKEQIFQVAANASDPEHTYTIAYQVSNKDTTLYLNKYGLHNKLIEETAYERVTDQAVNGSMATGIQLVVNRSLFTGKYHNHSQNNQKEVTFSDDGKVNGLAAFRSYEINTDFTEQNEDDENLDFIMFDNKYGSADYSYNFKFSGDTLILFKKNKASIKLRKIKAL